jgi:hypothetical protein
MSCPLTPERGSYFCSEHKNNSTEIYFKISDSLELLIDVSNIKESRKKNFLDYRIYDCFVDSEDTVLYLLATKKGKYLWTSKPPQNLIQEFSCKFSKSIEKNYSALTNCQINKEFPIPCKKKCRTTGILLSVYNCGIICGYRELFSSESPTQVSIFLLDLMQFSESSSKYLIYDNACSLEKFLKNRNIKQSSERGLKLDNMKLVIDRLHLKNHVDPECHKNFDANNYDELFNINTVVCEQTNFWMSRFKYIMKHMNFHRFNFFMYIILNKYNMEKLDQRITKNINSKKNT